MLDEGKFIEFPASTLRLGGWRWFAAYAVMAMIIQWPLVGSITTHISYGHEQEITVPLLNLWTIWWNADRASDWFRGYWDAPIFFPTKGTFVFSETQPTSIVVAPIIWLTGNRGLAYNVYQLLILALNGLSAHRLLRRIGHIRWLAFCGGVMSQILPFVMWQFGVVQLTTLFGIHWTIHAVLDLFRICENRRRTPDEDVESENVSRDTHTSLFHSRMILPCGVRLGFAYGITYWLCNYWGLFLTLLLVPSCVWFLNRRLFDRSFGRDLILAGIIAAAMIGPFAYLQSSLSHEHHWRGSRSPDLIRDLSANWRDHTDVPWYTLFPRLEFPEKSRENLWPLGGGGLKLFLFPLGLIASMMVPQRRRWGLFVATFGALAFGLSLGPTIHISDRVPVLSGVCPYELLQSFVPGFSLIRSPFRFAVFVQLAVVWLTIESLDLLNPSRWIDRTTPTRELPSWSAAALLNSLFGIGPVGWRFVLLLIPMIFLSILATAEAVPPVTKLYELPPCQHLPSWVRWLRHDAESNTAIACLPFPIGESVANYEETSIWMYWTTFHHRPMVNGYSGFFPETFMKIKEGLEKFERTVDDESAGDNQQKFKFYAKDNVGLKLLNESPIHYVVVKRSFATQEDILAHPETGFYWVLVASDEASQIDVYHIGPIEE